ncbi:MAG: NAD(P)-dependent oxidoreductase [Bryobacteraceae bacterium]|nr:NAD(P)-dependent oxidoreductase [Bryobacteraceae bacterium]
MRVLITGNKGYIGSVITPMIAAAGHETVGLDTGLFEHCTFGEAPPRVPQLDCDLRDVQASDLEGFDAIVHLAALCNDPLGDLNPELTMDINYAASVRLARLAKEAGVPLFLYASSCSLYGASGEDMVTEEAEFQPLTAYAKSKVLTEQEVSRLADDSFSPVFLRNATVYGLSPRLRLDLVVNHLVASACATGVIYLKSDGTPWRPLVHVEDVGRSILAALEAPRSLIHNQSFNVGSNDENYQIWQVAEIVNRIVPGSRIEYAPGATGDLRCYRVDFSKIHRTLPNFKTEWTVESGAHQLYRAFTREGFPYEDVDGPRYQRLKQIRALMSGGLLDSSLRWVNLRQAVVLS